MTQINPNADDIFQQPQITYNEAKRAVESMNLIDGFLFDSSIENEDDAKTVIGAILRTVFNKEIKDLKITSQKVIQPIDTRYHGIRLDAMIDKDESGNLIATIYDAEVENRPADKDSLPKRLRFYNSLIDSRLLESGNDYDTLPNYTSITISSYDPFTAGDMYYEAKTVLKTHPDIPYNDGITHIFLYCNGKVNKDFDAAHGKKLQEVLKYIVSGEKLTPDNKEVNDLEKIVSKIKNRQEVTKQYMKQWDRERHLIRDAKNEAKLDYAMTLIRLNRKHNISDEDTKADLINDFGISESSVSDLFAQVDSEDLVSN